MTENKKPCRKCQSIHTAKLGKWTLRGGVKAQRYKCFECGHIWVEPIGGFSNGK